MIIKGGTNIVDVPIGVLSLESYNAKPPGHIKYPFSFNFPINYKIVKGVTAKDLIYNHGPHLLAPFKKAMKELEEEGVRAITGSCGFLALYQSTLAAQVDVPVFMSSLIQLPMVSHMLKPGRKIGVVTASKAGLTPDHLAAVGADGIPVCIAGMDDCREFTEVIIEKQRVDLDYDKVLAEVIAVTKNMVEGNAKIGAIVFECTDLPPFAFEIQKQINLPIFDLTTLTNMVSNAVVQRPYKGLS